MQRRASLPAAFSRYDRLGGALEFAIFDDADDSPQAVAEAIRLALPRSATFSAERLLELGSRQINEKQFFGSYLSEDGRDLIRRGTWRTADGQQFTDATFRQLAGLQVKSGGHSPPDPGEGGNFALGFAFPVHGPRGDPLEWQQLFNAVRAVLLPPATPAEIRDWASPQLGEVSDYFAAGLEWWGVYLFSIYLPEWRQLAIVLGSTTD